MTISPKYALLLLGVTGGAISPIAAGRVILRDLQNEGYDFRGAIAQAKEIFGRSTAMLDALDALLSEGPEESTPAKKDSAPRVIQVRQIR